MFISAIHPQFNTVVALNNVSLIDVEQAASFHDINIVGCSGCFTQEGTFEGEYFIGIDKDGDILQFKIKQVLILVLKVWDIVKDEMLLNIVRNELNVQQMISNLGSIEIPVPREKYAIAHSQ